MAVKCHNMAHLCQRVSPNRDMTRCAVGDRLYGNDGASRSDCQAHHRSAGDTAARPAGMNDIGVRSIDDLDPMAAQR